VTEHSLLGENFRELAGTQAQVTSEGPLRVARVGFDSATEFLGEEAAVRMSVQQHGYRIGEVWFKLKSFWNIVIQNWNNPNGTGYLFVFIKEWQSETFHFE